MCVASVTQLAEKRLRFVTAKQVGIYTCYRPPMPAPTTITLAMPLSSPESAGDAETFITIKLGNTKL